MTGARMGAIDKTVGNFGLFHERHDCAFGSGPDEERTACRAVPTPMDKEPIGTNAPAHKFQNLLTRVTRAPSHRQPHPRPQAAQRRILQ